MAMIKTITMEDFDKKEFRYEKAKKKAKNLRGFYFNVMAYCVVIPTIITVNLIYMPEFHWFWFSMLGWGTGLLAHGMEVFQFNPFLGKNWEERKMQEFIDEELEKRKKVNNQ